MRIEETEKGEKRGFEVITTEIDTERYKQELKGFVKQKASQLSRFEN